jgi:hypothetical protein
MACPTPACGSVCLVLPSPRTVQPAQVKAACNVLKTTVSCLPNQSPSPPMDAATYHLPCSPTLALHPATHLPVHRRWLHPIHLPLCWAWGLWVFPEELRQCLVDLRAAFAVTVAVAVAVKLKVEKSKSQNRSQHQSLGVRGHAPREAVAAVCCSEQHKVRTLKYPENK